MKKKYILTAALIALLGITYFSIISPIYKSYKNATIITNFAEDSENVFVNTFHGIFKINKKTNQISEINFLINKIVVDENDEKWLISHDTLYSFKNENKILSHNSNFNQLGFEQTDLMWDLTIDQFGTKWIFVDKLGSDEELYSYNNNTWQKHHIPRETVDSHPQDEIFIDKSGNICLPSNKMFSSSYHEKDGSKRTLISFTNHLLILDNPTLWEPASENDTIWKPMWTKIDFETKFTLDKSYNDRNNNIWFAGTFDGKNTLYRFEYPDFVKYDLDKGIKAIASDKEENIWIATEVGIEKLNDKKTFIEKKGITDMFIDSNNKIWIGCYDSHKLECYDGKEWKSYNYEIFKLVLKEFFSQLF